MAATADSPSQPQRFSESGWGEQDRLEMYGGIGDIWGDYGRRRRTGGVNQQRGGVRREIVWLPECFSNFSPLVNSHRLFLSRSWAVM
jgi:hypothetical protein